MREMLSHADIPTALLVLRDCTISRKWWHTEQELNTKAMICLGSSILLKTANDP